MPAAQVLPARRHPPGATVRCTYLEIPEAPETLPVLGSRPWWIWGSSTASTQPGVAIGNEALHTRETPAGPASSAWTSCDSGSSADAPRMTPSG
jgi:hypothetical protein